MPKATSTTICDPATDNVLSRELIKKIVKFKVNSLGIQSDLVSIDIHFSKRIKLSTFGISRTGLVSIYLEELQNNATFSTLHFRQCVHDIDKIGGSVKIFFILGSTNRESMFFGRYSFESITADD
jgi:hypothetical protein